MLTVHERLAELFILSRQRRLTTTEEAEQQQCLQVNAMYYWELARLNNEALLAASTEDAEWQQDIGAQLFELRVTGRVPRRRK